MKQHNEINEMLGDFMAFESSDFLKLKNASQFFQDHISMILAVLGLYSLPYCYAGANGARVLVESKKITDDPGKRLAETAEFVMDVCGPDAFEPNGRGLISILYVRMLHAGARHYTSNKIKDEVPVNQDDQLATLLSFSLIVIRGLRKIGISISDDQANDYLFMWSLIGVKLGINRSYIPQNIRQASQTEREIRRREFGHSNEGVILTKSLTRFINEQNTQLKALRAEDLIYFFLENQANLLGIEIGLGYSASVIKQILRTQHVLGRINGDTYLKIRQDLKQQLILLDTELRF